MSSSLPIGWKLEPLGQLAQVVSGGTPSRHVPEFWRDGTIPWVTPTDITNTGGRYLSESCEGITELGLQSCSAKKLPPGALLMTSRATLGEVRIALREVCTNQGFKSLIPFRGVNGHFLYYQIGLNKERYKGFGIGSTFLEVNKRDTERFELLVAPEPEQRLIAEILSTMDEAIEQTEALIAKYQQIKAGLMHDLFTRGITPDGHLRPTRAQAPHLYRESPLGWIPKEWSSGLLSDFLLGGPKNGYSPQEVDEWSGLYTLGLGCLTTEGFRPNHLKMVALGSSACHDALLQDGDFLLSRSNTRELVGLCGIYRDVGCPCIYPDLMMRIRPNGKTSAQFLEALLLSPLMRVRITSAAVGTSGSMVKLNSRAVLRLQLAMPEKDEQAHILNLIHAQRDTLMSLECDLAKLCQQRQGLMKDLLTARVRVKVAEPASI